MIEGWASRTVAWVLVPLISAAASVSHEIVWGVVLSRVVGNTAWGVGLTLTIFMAGMGAGTLLAIRLLPRCQPARRFYILVELTAGASALAATAAFMWGGLPSRWLGGDALGPWSLVVDIGYGVVALAPPALAIGATYPILVAVLVHDSRGSHRVGSLYVAGLAWWGESWASCSRVSSSRRVSASMAPPSSLLF